MGNIMLHTEFLKPICSSSSRCNDNGICLNSLATAGVLDYDALANLVIVYNEVLTLNAKENLNSTVNKVTLYGIVNVLCLLRTEMSYRAVN